MNKLFGEIKNKKLLIFTAAVGVILFAAVFLFAALVNKNKIAENPIVPAVTKEKNKITPLTDEDIKAMIVPAKGKITPLTDEDIKAMIVPAK